MTKIDILLWSLVGPLIALFFWLFLVMLPVAAYTEAECLAQGYPKAAVTWNLHRYCMNMDGAVTVKVKGLE